MNPVIDRHGNQCWYNEHRQFHRLDGPAMILPDKTAFWYKDGRLHREDGPAAIYSDDCRVWYQNGRLHRTDGPAWMIPDGAVRWYVNGIEIVSTSQFKKLTGISNEDLSVLLLKYGNISDKEYVQHS